MDKKFLKAIGIRALKTTFQTLASEIPAGFVITPIMIEEANWSYLYIVGAWLGTGILAGLVSLLTNIATGIPEVPEK